MTPAAEVWASFSHDPRLGANAALRATDGDRDVVHQVLTDAYADGRLDREEFDSRTAQTAGARTLGELPPLLADLVAPAPVPSGRVQPASAAVLRQRAVAKYRADRRDAFLGFLAPSFICLVIWFVLGADAFFWPGFVIAGTGINVLSMLIRRENIIDENTRRLEKKQAKEQAKELQSRPPEDKGDIRPDTRGPRGPRGPKDTRDGSTDSPDSPGSPDSTDGTDEGDGTSR